MLDRLKAHLDSITPEQFAKEFDEVQEWFQCEVEDCPHCAEDIAQMQDEDTFKVWECCGMEECICKGSDVEKLAEIEYPIFDGDLLGIAHNQKHSRIDFIKGYNKAKETLYTEEQVREVIRNCFKSNSLGFLITEDDMMRTIKKDKPTSSQTEISDEEIEKEAEKITNIGNRREYWKQGIKWYREQLKLK